MGVEDGVTVAEVDATGDAVDVDARESLVEDGIVVGLVNISVCEDGSGGLDSAIRRY